MNRKTPTFSKEELKGYINDIKMPFYIYKKEKITEQYNKLVENISYQNKKIFYACKANANTEVLMHLKSLGSGIEAVSLEEVEKALSLGFRKEQISFTSNFLSKESFVKVIKSGVRVNVDSTNQLIWLGEELPNSEVYIRINTGVGDGHHEYTVTGGEDSKMGIHHNDLEKVKDIARKYNLKVVGVHQHLGSGVSSLESFRDSVETLLSFAKDFPEIKSINIGGGLNIPYKIDDEEFDIVSYGELVTNLTERFKEETKSEVELCIEPGRYLVAEAGALVVKVTDIKENPTKTFVGVNAGLNHLIRPMLYGSYHHIINISNEREEKVVTIVGNTCESGDIIGRDMVLNDPKIGDVLLILDAGAYGYSMGSEYHLRKRPKEIVI